MFPLGPIDNQLTVVQVMTLGQTGNKPLSEPKMMSFIDA